MAKRLLTYLEATVTKVQHKTPCSDCPFARTAVKGWLGGMTVGEYLLLAHSDNAIMCHTRKRSAAQHHQCAGAAIYRANTCKRVELPNMTLPRDTKKVFSRGTEFALHHSNGKLDTVPKVQQEVVKAMDQQNKKMSEER